MIYTCCDELRRNAVEVHPTLNGIDYLEVLHGEAPAGSPVQRSLLLRLLKPAVGLARENVRIEGGERVRNIRVEWVAPASAVPPGVANAAELVYFAALPEPDHVLVIRTDAAGDFSTYTLRLVRSPVDDMEPAGFDPQLASVDFSFKVECESDFDCKPVRVCAEPQRSEPPIDYLAKDYASFRRLILGRIGQLVPGWAESSPADLGVTLAELVAYVGDHLSYQQDAVATEAYLETARRRTSLRRHALLVDYRMHDGCNARAWLHLEVEDSGFTLRKDDVEFYTQVEGVPVGQLDPDSPEQRAALSTKPEVFLPMHDITLYSEHNILHFYTWGDRRCCLPPGATRATLRGHYPQLQRGDVLVFEEVLGPFTGNAADADPRRRHAVRLTFVRVFKEGSPLADPLTANTRITEIAWHEDDALPFSLCLSALTDTGQFIEDVSVARGNVLLVDHGRKVQGEDLGRVPTPHLILARTTGSTCTPESPLPIPARFRPRLKEGPLTQVGTVVRLEVKGGRTERRRVPFDLDASAAAAMRWQVADALPSIALQGGTDPDPWQARRDLLNSGATAHDFVVETENDGSAYLRFGDDIHGERPAAGARFTASYRAGNGLAGNVGAATIVHVVTKDARIRGVRNPLAAGGGVEAESAAEVRRRAPRAFRTQERAVTPGDYAAMAMRDPSVQRAVGTPRWTGSWHTMFVTVDRRSGRLVDDSFEGGLREALERYRMAGHDLEVDGPRYVALEVELEVCVEPDHFRSDVEAALFAALSNRDLPDGTRGLFHPDNFTFGQPVYLSPVYKAAHGVAGVASIVVSKFQRQGTDTNEYLDAGVLDVGRLELARLDNDPNYPEHGVLRLTLHGGK